MAQKFLSGIDISGNIVVDSNSAVGATVLDIQGTQGQLFSLTNSLSGDLFSVSDISGIPILNVNSNGLVTIDGALNSFNVTEFIKHEGDTGTNIQFLTGQMILKNSGGKYINLHSNNIMYFDASAYQFYSGNATFAGTVTANGTVLTGATDISGKVSKTGDTITSGTNAGLTINHDSFGLGLIVHRNHADNSPSITFKNNDGQLGILFAQEADNNPYWRQGTNATNHKIWHAGNDGASSGLDADTLDGNHASAFAPSSVVNQTDFVSAANGGTFADSISVHGNILLTGTATTSNQSRMIDFTGFDKEGTTDFSDRAYIAHTTNTGGHTGSVLVISSQNDANDGIAFATNASSKLKWNSNNLATESYVDTAVANLIDNAPENLNTLNELAEALNDDDDAIVTINTALGNRVRVDTASQGLTSTQKSNARTNIDAAPSSVVNQSDFVSKASGGTFGGIVKLDSELQFLRGSTEYSNYIRSSAYPSEGYSGSTSKYWLEYGAKGGHHFVLNTDGGSGSSENDYDDFTIWNGAVDGDRLLEVTNAGNATFAGTISSNGKFIIANNGTATWGAANDYGQLSWDTGYALIRGQSGKGIKLQTNSSSTALTLDTSQNATFSGSISATSGSFTEETHIADVVDGPFTALRLMNQKTYGSGTGTNEKVRFAMGISESGIAYSGREGFVIELGVGAETDSSDGIVDFKVRDGGTLGTYQTVNGNNKSVTFSDGATYHKIQTYYSGSYTSGFKFSDYNGGIWYDAGADDLTLNAGHANSQMLLNSGGAIALTLDASQNATFASGVKVLGSIESRKNIVSNSNYNIAQISSTRTTDDYGGLNKTYAKLDVQTPGPNTDGASSAHGLGHLSIKLADNAGNSDLVQKALLRHDGELILGGFYPQTSETELAGLTIRSRYAGSNRNFLRFQTDHSSTTTEWTMAKIYAGDGGNFNGKMYFQVATGSNASDAYNSGHDAQLETAMFIDDTKEVTFNSHIKLAGASPYIQGTGSGQMRIKHTSGETMYIRPDETGSLIFFEGANSQPVYFMTQTPTVNNTTNESAQLKFHTRSKQSDGNPVSKYATIKHLTHNIGYNYTTLDFAGSDKSKFNMPIEAAGGLYFTGDTHMGFIPHPRGAQYRSDSSSDTGYIMIKLPTDIGNSPDDMISFYVDIYDYTTSETISVFVSGYNYRHTPTSSNWVSPTAIINTKLATKDFNVRFGHDGTNFYVAIGETDSVWAHPSIVVRDFQCSYRGNAEHYIDGWAISTETTTLSGVDETQTGNLPQATHATTATTANAVAWGNITSRPYIETGTVTSATTTTTVTSVVHATYTAAFFDFVIKNGTNVRAGIVYACHDGTNVEFAETSTVDLGDTSDVTLSVDISGANMRLRATTISSTWTIKSLIRAI